MNLNDQGLPQPELSLVKSHRIRCYGCGTWLVRLPQWDNCELGKAYQCEKCGCTSITYDEGRPWGPRSRHWAQLMTEFADLWPWWSCYPSDLDWVLSTVEVRDEDR